MPLVDALGRVLAERVASPITIPAWDNSAMDGYAVRAADIAGATESKPVSLAVLERVAAGGFPSRAVTAGMATRIATGAPVPEGADTVVRVEDTDGGAERVAIRSTRDARKNVRPRGEDISAGGTVLESGLAARRGADRRARGGGRGDRGGAPAPASRVHVERR